MKKEKSRWTRCPLSSLLGLVRQGGLANQMHLPHSKTVSRQTINTFLSRRYHDAWYKLNRVIQNTCPGDPDCLICYILA